MSSTLRHYSFRSISFEEYKKLLKTKRLELGPWVEEIVLTPIEEMGDQNFNLVVVENEKTESGEPDSWTFISWSSRF